MRIVNTCHYADLPREHPAFQRVLAKAEFVTCEKKQLTSEELLEFVQGADALISGTDFIRAALIERFPKSLKVISRPAVGYDRVDIAAARAHGIDVCNAPGSNCESVADLLLALMVMGARDVYNCISDVREGKWGVRRKGVDLMGKTVGIIGLGAIGKSVARRCLVFGMDIGASDPYIDRGFCAEHSVKPLELGELLECSDFIVLALPLMESTYHIINAETIARMKDGVIIANDARGGVVDTAAMAAALRSGKVGFYATDVTDPEPPPPDYELFGLDNCVITPHMGAETTDATNNMMAMALTNAMDVLEGLDCKNIVNRQC